MATAHVHQVCKRIEIRHESSCHGSPNIRPRMNVMLHTAAGNELEGRELRDAVFIPERFEPQGKDMEGNLAAVGTLASGTLSLAPPPSNSASAHSIALGFAAGV